MEGSGCEDCFAGSISALEGLRDQCYDCPNLIACAGGGNCSMGYEGALCGSCVEGYYPLGNACKECASAPYQTIAALVVAAIILLFVSRIELR